MTKLPDNEALRSLVNRGFSNAQIAEMYDVTVQGVNFRLSNMGIQRKPWSNTATAIMEQAWPSAETGRSKHTNSNAARRLWAYVRYRLGDPQLSERQKSDAVKFQAYVEKHAVVLHLDSSREVSPWVFVPRMPADGRLVIRWPEGREKPLGAHLEAISLPAPSEDGTPK
ncbi:hypothetical protein [Streptomyces sp. NPDC001422]|uniref:hypothetical protein n=1 Tax=Streptomyces sp. NPDC001422 TaxID=3364575 RepID=UPI0036800752